MLSTALWVALAVAAMVHMLATKASVRLVGKGAENAWDNAFGYLVMTGLLWYPVKWTWGLDSWWPLLFIPPLCTAVLLWALKAIYQVSTKRAVIIGAVHLAITSVVGTLLTLVTGFVAAWIIYGRIVSDPLILVRIVLRLIGIDPWF